METEKRVYIVAGQDWKANHICYGLINANEGVELLGKMVSNIDSGHIFVSGSLRVLHIIAESDIPFYGLNSNFEITTTDIFYSFKGMNHGDWRSVWSPQTSVLRRDSGILWTAVEGGSLTCGYTRGDISKPGLIDIKVINDYQLKEYYVDHRGGIRHSNWSSNPALQIWDLKEMNVGEIVSIPLSELKELISLRAGEFNKEIEATIAVLSSEHFFQEDTDLEQIKRALGYLTDAYKVMKGVI